MEKHVFYILFLVGKDVLYEKLSRNSNLDTNKWHSAKHLDFIKNKKKNYQNWSSYNRETPIRNLVPDEKDKS
jgi:hypothetical protein